MTENSFPTPVKVKQLIDKGVTVILPHTVFIDDDVDIHLVAPKGVIIYPGCRISGNNTIIGEGCHIGEESPAIIENCALGKDVRLKGGFFVNSVFFDNVSIGSCAHVRECCLLEEYSSCAHAVGMKHTILMPFVTLGSLINFCDCLMAGGSSRRDHSEVGSSFVHFNYTPKGDKATASMFGDVPKGVMLDSPRIFLGGQSGIVGPIKTGFGLILSAGGVLRKDVTEDNMLIAIQSPKVRRHVFENKSIDKRVVERNYNYIANLAALKQWYRHVRCLFFNNNILERKLVSAALEVIEGAIKERLKRFSEYLMIVEEPADLVMKLTEKLAATDDIGFYEKDYFLEKLPEYANRNYIDAIKALPQETKGYGSEWLYKITVHINQP